MKKALKPAKGFTLVELMVVIVIIGILAAISVPLYNNYTNSAKAAEAKQIFSAFNNQAKIARAQYGAYNALGPGAAWQGGAASDLAFESKYFNGGVGYIVTKTGYQITLQAGAPFVSVTLTHEDGNPDVVTVTPSDIPGVGTGW